MTEEEAITFCENTECKDCPVIINNIGDWRTHYEKIVLI